LEELGSLAFYFFANMDVLVQNEISEYTGADDTPVSHQKKNKFLNQLPAI
jgi:hypothetical protein